MTVTDHAVEGILATAAGSEFTSIRHHQARISPLEHIS